MSRNPYARHAWKQNKPKVIPDKRADHKPGVYYCAQCGKPYQKYRGERLETDCNCGNHVKIED